jgi:hypothetical protein
LPHTKIARGGMFELKASTQSGSSAQVRHEHNTSIRSAASAMEGRRAQFFNRRMDVLTPFITPRAANAIR